MNELATLYFKVSKVPKIFGAMGSKSSGIVMQKNYTIEYSGALNRTYTYLNLLDLEQVRL